MKNLIGVRLRQARASANPKITQAQLAARLQVKGISIDRVAISKIESGTRPVTDIELVAIAEAIGVSVFWLLGKTQDRQHAALGEGM